MLVKTVHSPSLDSSLWSGRVRPPLLDAGRKSDSIATMRNAVQTPHATQTVKPARPSRPSQLYRRLDQPAADYGTHQRSPWPVSQLCHVASAPPTTLVAHSAHGTVARSTPQVSPRSSNAKWPRSALRGWPDQNHDRTALSGEAYPTPSEETVERWVARHGSAQSIMLGCDACWWTSGIQGR